MHSFILRGFLNLENILYDETRFSMKESEKGFMHKQTNAQDCHHEILENISKQNRNLNVLDTFYLCLEGKYRHLRDFEVIENR